MEEQPDPALKSTKANPPFSIVSATILSARRHRPRGDNERAPAIGVLASGLSLRIESYVGPPDGPKSLATGYVQGDLPLRAEARSGHV